MIPLPLTYAELKGDLTRVGVKKQLLTTLLITAVAVAQIPSCATLPLWLPKQSGLKRV